MITTNDPQAAVVSALGAGTEESRAATDTGGAASIDKVRDILFGGQMRDYERRFIKLEERLLQETSELKDEVRKRLAALGFAWQPVIRARDPELAAALSTGASLLTRLDGELSAVH